MPDPASITATAAFLLKAAPALAKFTAKHTSKNVHKSGYAALDLALTSAKESELRSMTKNERKNRKELLDKIAELRNSQLFLNAIGF
jgi:hypothetical protein